MNVNAIYNVTANIQDLLDPSLTKQFPILPMPVNCVLKRRCAGGTQPFRSTSNCRAPTEGAPQRQVKSLVDTEDMMTLQIIYLLVLNKFIR